MKKEWVEKLGMLHYTSPIIEGMMFRISTHPTEMITSLCLEPDHDSVVVLEILAADGWKSLLTREQDPDNPRDIQALVEDCKEYLDFLFPETLDIEWTQEL